MDEKDVFIGLDLNNNNIINADIPGTDSATFEMQQGGSKGTFDVSGNTADRTYTMQDADGTVAFLTDIPAANDLASTLAIGNNTIGNDIEVDNGDSIVFGALANNNTITESAGNRLGFNSDAGFFFTTGTWAMLQASSNGNLNVGSTTDSTKGIQLIPNSGYIEVKSTAPSGVTTLSFSNATASRAIDMPDADGTVALVSDTQKINVVSKVFGDSPYTAVANDVVLYDATGGASTVNLPAAASNANTQITVKKTDASVNAVTIDGNASETIDGALTQAINAQYESITVVCDGSNWFII